MRKSFVLTVLFLTAAVLVLVYETRRRQTASLASSPTNTPPTAAAAPTNKTPALGMARRRTTTGATSNRTNLNARTRERSATAAAGKTVKRPDTPEADPIALENTYRAQTNEVTRYGVIDELSDRGDLSALQALERLFRSETDITMKMEMLDSLSFYDGNTAYKLQMLTTAIHPTQPKEVRQSAIDAMLDLDDPSVVPVLQSYRNDPDEDIRESTEDAIDFYQG